MILSTSVCTALFALQHRTSGEEWSHLLRYSTIMFVLMTFTAEREHSCSHVPSLLWAFFECLGRASRALLKKLWENRRKTLMCRWRPTKGSVELTAGFVAMLEAQSASWVPKQRPSKVMVWDTQHVGTAWRSKRFTMVSCQIPVNYEIAIPNSMTLGTGEKWL